MIQYNKELRVRPYTSEDYSTIVSYWEYHKFPSVPEKVLPPTGIVVESDVLVCAGWLYKTDSPIAWIEWIVANPMAREKDEALNLLIDALIAEAGSTHPVIFTSTVLPKLAARLESFGFAKGDLAQQLIRSY